MSDVKFTGCHLLMLHNLCISFCPVTSVQISFPRLAAVVFSDSCFYGSLLLTQFGSNFYVWFTIWFKPQTTVQPQTSCPLSPLKKVMA